MRVAKTFEQIRTRGWVVLEKLIPPDEVGRVRAATFSATERHRNPNAPERIGHVSSFIRYDQSLVPYLADARLIGLVEALLGPHCRISFTSATINEPGNARGSWHADWPFNQKNAGHIPSPYPDIVMHLTTIWMLSAFSDANGGTLLVPGSHRRPDNPTGNNGIPAAALLPDEINASGPAGSVLVMDSRLWHATAPNTSAEPRVAVVVRYAPWWLDLSVLDPESAERAYLTKATGKSDNQVPRIPATVYSALPENVKSLFRHWIVP